MVNIRTWGECRKLKEYRARVTSHRRLWPAVHVPSHPCPPASCLLPQSPAVMGALFDYLVFPLFIPFILLWLLAARALSFVAPLLFPLTWSLAARLSWACPFIPRIWELNGWFRGTLMKLGFEVSPAGLILARTDICSTAWHHYSPGPAPANCNDPQQTQIAGAPHACSGPTA